MEIEATNGGYLAAQHINHHNNDDCTSIGPTPPVASWTATEYDLKQQFHQKKAITFDSHRPCFSRMGFSSTRQWRTFKSFLATSISIYQDHVLRKPAQIYNQCLVPL
jgi:hypothetical protein